MAVDQVIDVVLVGVMVVVVVGVVVVDIVEMVVGIGDMSIAVVIVSGEVKRKGTVWGRGKATATGKSGIT